MKNIHILPTDKSSRLHFDSKLFLSPNYQDSKTINSIVEGRNIYITSDEEIKEGVDQWYLDKFLNKPYNSSGAQYSSKQDVIIMTTDQDLIKDGVQAIDNEFLEWFVKNPSCEEVNIRKVANGVKNHKLTYEYKIIIPKEEPKQECEKCFGTGEDQMNDIGYEKCTNCNGKGEKPKQETLIKPDTIDGSWLSPVPAERQWQEEKLREIFGHYPNASPKWQYMNGLIQNSLDAREMYSEEDMKKAFEAGKKGYMRGSYLTQEYYFTWNNFKSWVEQFKKK